MLKLYIFTLVLAALFCCGHSFPSLKNPFSGPLHASCHVDWTIGVSCNVCSQALINQIKIWSGTDCKSGEKCLYKFVSFENNVLKAIHETPVKHYKDDLTFTFIGAGNSCEIKGYSTSETWYAILDYGTNYCNLHNLVTGAGLDKKPNYKETTSDSRCTQYSSANCDKY